MIRARYPCPCCGHVTLWGAPGAGDVCQVCSWQDDPVQLRWPDWAGGANRPSLVAAQRTAASIGVSDAAFCPVARTPTPAERPEPGWRPIDPNIDVFEPLGRREREWPRDLTRLYWWRPTYWRG